MEPEAGTQSRQIVPAAGSRCKAPGLDWLANCAQHAVAPRRRRWAAKVRTGCLTCRRRRIKCDEAKPACQRCLARGVACEPSPPEHFTPSPDLSIYQPREQLGPAGVQLSDRQLRAFGLFRRKTAKQIAGSFDHVFWTDNVVRAAKEYPTIWHAALALAAMHERSHSGRSKHDQLPYRAFALEQYTTSINCLVGVTMQREMSRSDKDVVLLSSILYTGLCCLQGDLRQAVSHIRNGIRLFYEWFPDYEDDDESTRDSSAQAILNHRSLLVIMKQFESQFANRFGQDTHPVRRRRRGPPRCSPAPFTSATQAYFEFQPLLTSLLELGRHADASSTEQRHPAEDIRLAHRQEFGIWSAKFRKLQQSRRRPASDTEGIQILEILWTSVQIVLHVNMHESAEAFDRFEPLYAKVADLAEQVLHLRQSKASKEEDRSGFSYSLAVSEILYFAGIHCWHPRTRRRIISLLERWPAHDGVWDTKLVGAICKAVMEFEQRGWADTEVGECGCGCVVGEFVCGGHRVLEHEVDLCGHREANVTMRTGVFDGSVKTIIIAW